MADIDSSLPIRTQADADERVQVKIVDSTTPSQQVEVGADSRLHTNANLQVGDADVAISNPVPVSIEESGGDEICDYQTSAAVAKDASVQHDYAVSGSKTWIGKQWQVSGSGFLKAELQLETAAASGTYNTKMTAFNSTSSPNIVFDLKSIAKQVTGANVRIEITNLDNQAQDVYSNTLGVEV